jgi:hypothetical protein
MAEGVLPGEAPDDVPGGGAHREEQDPDIDLNPVGMVAKQRPGYRRKQRHDYRDKEGEDDSDATLLNSHEARPPISAQRRAGRQDGRTASR